jgi:hypothetical protein
MPLPSLAAEGGDEEDASADTGDEAADVRERDLVLVRKAEAIRGYEQHGLGELGERPRGSRRRGHDGEAWTEQDEGHGGSEGHIEEKQEVGRMWAGVWPRRRRGERRWAMASH